MVEEPIFIKCNISLFIGKWVKVQYNKVQPVAVAAKKPPNVNSIKSICIIVELCVHLSVGPSVLIVK